jgi:hypothetical protein
VVDGKAVRGLCAAPGELSCDQLARALHADARLSDQSVRRLLDLMLRFLSYLDRGWGITWDCSAVLLVSLSVLGVLSTLAVTGSQPALYTGVNHVTITYYCLTPQRHPAPHNDPRNC